jgi:hypothetical protein
MSSVLRHIKEPTSLRREFTVFPYVGFGEGNRYYFTVRDNSLYRIEADLINVDWVVARDMGTSERITTIDPEIIEYWENQNLWTNISVIRPGEARKFQVVSIVRGNLSVSNYGPAANAAAYLDADNIAIYNYEGVNMDINDPLILGNATTTISTEYEQNLPYGTFWAVNDPVIIKYDFSDVTYRRAIKHRIDETTFFGAY